MSTDGRQLAKRAVGGRVAEMVEDGMCLGIGTGSTAAYAIEAIGRRVAADGIRVVGVPTSYSADRLAREHGIPLTTLDDVQGIDLAFDGADEVDPQFNLIKGRGAAHTREKVVASEAARFMVLIDITKRVEVLGSRMPVPVEVIPVAVAPVSRAIVRLGGDPSLRMGANKDGPVVTDHGMWIIDAAFRGIPSPEELDRDLNQIPGVVGHGLFVGMATDLLIGVSGEEVLHERARQRASR